MLNLAAVSKPDRFWEFSTTRDCSRVKGLPKQLLKALKSVSGRLKMILQEWKICLQKMLFQNNSLTRQKVSTISHRLHMNRQKHQLNKLLFSLKMRFCEPRSMELDRKSTRLNSSHVRTSYAVFCLKKKRSNPITSWPT